MDSLASTDLPEGIRTDSSPLLAHDIESNGKITNDDNLQPFETWYCNYDAQYNVNIICSGYRGKVRVLLSAGLPRSAKDFCLWYKPMVAVTT